MKDKISIIIPVYNSEQFIDKCLNSIINQTYQNLEIICINDGSTDNSLTVLNKYQKKDKRIKIIDKKNAGVSAARNDGIKLSTGEYVTFVDIDDWLELDAIEALYNTIKKENVDVVRGNYCITKNLNNESISNKGKLYNLKNKKIDISDLKNSKTVIDKIINGKIQCYVWLLFIKKEIIKNMHFKEEINFMEDTIFYQELMNQINSIYFLDKVTYHYYYNPNSLSRAKELYIKNMYILIDVHKSINKIINEGKFYSKERIIKLNNRFLYLILNYFYYIYHSTNKNKKEVINEINKILKHKYIQELIKNSKIKKLPLYLRIFITPVINKKYKLLFTLYDIRKSILNLITI